LFAAQVNPQMPRTFGDATVHQSHFDYAVKVDAPLPEHGGRPPTEVETKIGKQIAGNLVEDGQLFKWVLLTVIIILMAVLLPCHILLKLT